MTYKYYLLNSDSYTNVLLKTEDYFEVRLQMSSGDFGTHSVKGFNRIPKGMKVESIERFENEVCQICGR